jgi:hypothetical protein
VKKCQSINLSLQGEKIALSIASQGQSKSLGNMRHVFPPVIWDMIEDASNPLCMSDFGESLESNYLAVSKILRGTFAQAEPRTIMKSCKAVEKLIADSVVVLSDGTTATNYTDWFEDTDPETLDALGLQLEMNEAEISAWHMGSELIPPEADRTEFIDFLFTKNDQRTEGAKKP